MQWTADRFCEFSPSVKLSRHLRILEEPDRVVSLCMRPEMTATNMQGDAAAFETWALAVKVAGAKKVVLRWKQDGQNGAHFRRFCYRVTRFADLFKTWLEADPLPGTEIDNGEQFFLNEESEPRDGIQTATKRAEALDLSASEHSLEEALASDHPAALELKKLSGVRSVNRQLPVGVFRGKVAKSKLVFTGGRSAIDLWGVNGEKRLVLFELKNSKNKKLGALAELFFYAMVMRDLQRGILGFAPNTLKDRPAYHRIPKTEGIDAYILAPTFHPLIEGQNGAVLELLNQGLATAGVPIRFVLARMLPQHPFVR